MLIPEDKKENVLKRLDTLWPANKRQCPICNNNTWSIDEKIFQLSEFHQGALLAPGVIKPSIVLCCDTCGYTFLMNAIHLGALPRSPIGGDENE